MNDESVKTSKIDSILKQEAYLLTYVLRNEATEKPKESIVFFSNII